YLIEKNENGMIDLRKNLVKLIRSRIINRFYLTEGEAAVMTASDEYPDDALSIYCLSIGGAYLLDAFSQRDAYEWNTGNIIKSSEKIGKQILATEFMLKLIESISEKMIFFRCLPTYQIKTIAFKSTFHFCLKENGESIYFIGDVFRSDSNIVDVRERLLKLESLLCTKAYLKYYPDAKDAPILLVFADTEDFLQQIAIELKATKIEKVRFSTDKRIFEKEVSEGGAFLKYNEISNTFTEVRINMFRNKETEEVIIDMNEDSITEVNIDDNEEVVIEE
ncbi:MAG: hypothetical protein IJO27_02325, partial [Bacilli bacterium]|nr:hypothetical protein [Bacilli bacterium]